MDICDLTVHTSGILIESAKFVRWGILVGKKIYTPVRQETAVKHMSNPDARPGAWIDIKCAIIKDINAHQKATIYGFVNLVDREFLIPDDDGKIFGDGPEEAPIDRLPMRPVRLRKALSNNKIQEIAKLIIDQMGNKWLSKFRRTFLS